MVKQFNNVKIDVFSFYLSGLLFLLCWQYLFSELQDSCIHLILTKNNPKGRKRVGKRALFMGWVRPQKSCPSWKKKKHKEPLGLISFGFTFSLFYTSTLIRNHPTNQNKAKQNQIIKFVYLVSKVNCVWTKAWRSASNHWGNLLKMLFPESHLNPF